MDFDKNIISSILANLYDGVYFVDNYRRIVFWSEAAERITGYARDEMVGSMCNDSPISHLDDEAGCACMDGCHMLQSIRTQKVREGDRYILHKEGHRVLVIARTVPMVDANGNSTGAIQIFRRKYSRQSVQERFEALKKQALVDDLTDLPNRRAVDHAIETRLQELDRYGRSFGVMFIDIDHFKEINDKHGHEVGDKALKLAASTLMASIRPFDLLGRYGGEEFVGVLVNVEEPELKKIVHRARALVEKSVLHLTDDEIDITVSIGATMARPDETKADLIKRADALMYRSKKDGRNRVSFVSTPGEPL